MANYEIKRKANIGTSSLILIFIVLCLAVFAVLSLEHAKRQDLFSQKSASAVQEYYRADAQGVKFLQEMERTVREESGKNEACFVQEIPMQSGLGLRITLILDWEQKTVRVQEWKVYDREMLEIDQSMPVWTGMEEVM